MSDFGILLHRVQERRIRAGYRPPGPPREHMPPDYVEPCARYPTAALLSFLAAVGGAMALVALFVALLISANRTPPPAAKPKAAPAPRRVVVQAAGQSEAAPAATNEDPNADTPTKEVPIVGAPANLEETGTFSGTITFDGEPPAPKQLVVPPPPAQPIPEESLLIAPQTGGIANVVVFLDKAPPGVPIPLVPKQPARFAIAGGKFAPRVLIARTGQQVAVTNRDPAVENVHVFPLKNAAVNISVGPGLTASWTYNKPERVPLQIVSDFHAWMRAWHVVLDHPWAAVTDVTGAFHIKGLPPAKYEFKIWHERAGWLERKLPVEIKAGETDERELSYPAEKFDLDAGR